MTSSTLKTFVQFGAGNIGRSLVGQLFAKAGYQVIFIDAVPAIIDAMNAQGRYLVRVKGDVPAGQSAEIWVENVRGILASDSAAVLEVLAQAEMLGTAVGPFVLPKLFPVIAQGLLQRQAPVSIIMCENLRNAAGIARQGLGEQLPPDFDLKGRVGLVETSIGKMVPIMPGYMREQDPLEVWAEAYNQIIADGEGFIGTPPDVPGLVLKQNFAAYVDRKLFIHNLGHAAAAYFGHLQGKTYLWECMADNTIREAAKAAMWESARALIAQYPGEFNEQNLGEHIEDLLTRFANQALGDTVYRVGRDLSRKLSPEDRLIGALRLCARHGVESNNIARAIGAALCFRATDEDGNPFADDEKFQQQLAAHGPAAMLEQVSGLDPQQDGEAIATILTDYAKIMNR